MESVNILIAEGSPLFKQMFARAVAQVFRSSRADFAMNCEEALSQARRAAYDIVAIDAALAKPGLSEFMYNIREYLPCALLLVTAQPSKNCDKILAEALELGAAACMTKPIYSGYDENFMTVKAKIEEVALLLRDRKRASAIPINTAAKVKSKLSFSPELVLIASSTGGPAALGRVLPELEEGFPAPILVVQHIFPHFTGNLAADLNRKSRQRVKVAEDGEDISAGTVYIAPGGLHMKLNAEKRISLENSPHVRGVRPAADVLFSSVAEIPGISGVVAVILTGMGRDGENGLAALKLRQECVCLAQSEKTCVVYGMPRAVVERGLADAVIDLEKISRELSGFCYKVR